LTADDAGIGWLFATEEISPSDPTRTDPEQSTTPHRLVWRHIGSMDELDLVGWYALLAAAVSRDENAA
jgi:hypothetical protein